MPRIVISTIEVLAEHELYVIYQTQCFPQLDAHSKHGPYHFPPNLSTTTRKPCRHGSEPAHFGRSHRYLYPLSASTHISTHMQTPPSPSSTTSRQAQVGDG